MDWNSIQPDSLESIFEWAATQPWCQAMAACPQDPRWHAEGDVWTHTKMVCRQLLELEQWPTLNKPEQKVLLATALFHDVAKPLSTRTDSETGAISSPKHSVRGELLCRQILRHLNCELETREQVTALVRYHSRPNFLAEKPEPVQEVIRLSWLVNLRLLHLFSIADFRGRDSDSRTRPEENLLYLKLLAEEQNCLDMPYPFANDEARFLFFRSSRPDRSYVPYEDYSCRVTLLSGPPGSGKDTWISVNALAEPQVSLDELREDMDVEPSENQGRIAQAAREKCRALLRAKTSFVFNATNLLRLTRNRWINLFTDYGARVEIVYLEPPLPTILKNNRQRAKGVPENVIMKLLDKVEPPTWAEAHGLKYLISGTE